MTTLKTEEICKEAKTSFIEHIRKFIYAFGLFRQGRKHELHWQQSKF